VQPTHNCQVFSIGTSALVCVQLTRLEQVDRSEKGCFLNQDAAGCHARLVDQDRATGTVIFASSCDPFGTNPTGDQLFAMRSDGSGLRQITHARGVATDTPDVVEVELAGPFGYQ
jgi:hypothetical protein